MTNDEYVRGLRGRSFDGRCVATAGDADGFHLAALANDDGWHRVLACEGDDALEESALLVPPDKDVALAIKKVAERAGRAELADAIVWVT